EALDEQTALIVEGRAGGAAHRRQALLAEPRARRVEQRVGDLLVVDALEKTVEPDAVVPGPVVCVILDARNPPDRPTPRSARGPCEEVLRARMLPERVFLRGEQRADVHPQLRHPQRVAAVVLVGKRDEPVEAVPVTDGHDLHRAQMTPSALRSRANASSAWSSWSAVWVAMRLVRSRHCDGGTAGGTTGLVNTPASNSCRQNRNVFSSGPMSTGMIGVSVGPISKPSARSPSCRRRVFTHSRSRRSGSCCSTRRAASTPAVFAGGSAAVKIIGRAWCVR